MKILAVDTAGPTCSVAVTEGDRVLVEINFGMAQTHSRHLLPMVRSALDMADATVSDMDAFAVSKGPGSFTGLRIGMSCIKGMAAATGKPAIGISSLDVLACQASVAGFWICPMLDARRAEVYYALFDVENGDLVCVEKGSVAAVDRALEAVGGPCLFVGSGALAYRTRIEAHLGKEAAFAPADQHAIRAATLARAALKRFQSGDAEDAAGLAPVYMRKSDAELNAGNLRARSWLGSR